MDEAVQLCDRLIIARYGPDLEAGDQDRSAGVGETLLEIRGIGIWDSILENGRAYIEHMIVRTQSCFIHRWTGLIQALRPVSDRFPRRCAPRLWKMYFKLTGRGLWMNFRKPDLRGWYGEFSKGISSLPQSLEGYLSLTLSRCSTSCPRFGLGAYSTDGRFTLPILLGLIASSAMFATAYECTYGSFVR